MEQTKHFDDIRASACDAKHHEVPSLSILSSYVETAQSFENVIAVMRAGD